MKLKDYKDNLINGFSGYKYDPSKWFLVDNILIRSTEIKDKLNEKESLADKVFTLWDIFTTDTHAIKTKLDREVLSFIYDTVKIRGNSLSYYIENNTKDGLDDESIASGFNQFISTLDDAEEYKNHPEVFATILTYFKSFTDNDDLYGLVTQLLNSLINITNLKYDDKTDLVVKTKLSIGYEICTQVINQMKVVDKTTEDNKVTPLLDLFTAHASEFSEDIFTPSLEDTINPAIKYIDDNIAAIEDLEKDDILVAMLENLYSLKWIFFDFISSLTLEAKNESED